MVTGDNIHTAKHIARECGILSEGGLAMEGPDFRAKSEEELMQLLPQLQVLARSSPADKLVLVRTLKKMGDIVAVTGDGTNDAPALKESDVGMAMGIAGTEVSKVRREAAFFPPTFFPREWEDREKTHPFFLFALLSTFLIFFCFDRRPPTSSSWTTTSRRSSRPSCGAAPSSAASASSCR
jgi:hypothetical protein